MPFRFLPPILLVALLCPAAALPATGPPPQQPATDASEHVRRGAAHFDRAFYELTPRKRGIEAAREFELAIAEFEREIAARPRSVTAHTYLARIHTARGEHVQAAQHLDRVSEIEPGNVDACALAAQAWAEGGRFAEARARLAAAAARTSDPAVLARLAEYRAKLDAASPK